MRAGDRQHPAAAQRLLGQPLRTRHIGVTRIQNRLDQRIAARHHIADHIQIRAQRALGGIETLDQLDAERAQLVAHRRIDIGVAAGDAQTGLAGDRRQPAHEGPADSQYVDVHRGRSLPEAVV